MAKIFVKKYLLGIITHLVLVSNGLYASQEVGGEGLWDAVQADNASEIQRIIDAHPEALKIATPLGTTPFLMACATGRLKAVRCLIENGYDVNNVCGKCNKTPLLEAVRNGHLEVVAVLIKNGADVHASDARGMTPLHGAVRNGHPKVIAVLVKNGANIHACDKRGLTPLKMAEEMCAQRKCDRSVLRALRNDSGDSACNEKGVTPLHNAAGAGNLAEARALIAGGANVNAQDDGGDTPLHYAAFNDKLEMVKLLVENGSRAMARNDRGATVLNYTTNLSIAKLLVEKTGVDVNVCDDTGLTPLMEAAFVGALDLVGYLVGLGVDVNAQSKNGCTALHCAAQTGALAIVKLLVRCTANTSVKTKKGESVLAIAEKHHMREVAQFLRNVCAIQAIEGVSAELKQQFINELCSN